MALRFLLLTSLHSVTMILFLVSPSFAADLLRVGLIGLDSSHAVAFAKMINEQDGSLQMGDVKVVAAYAGGSPDLPASADRLEKFTGTITSMGIEIVPSIEVLLTKVNAVIINSVDGRVHLEQARPVLEAGIPLFIDKPLATSLEDAQELFALANKHGTPCFSSSTLRFCPEVTTLVDEKPVGDVVGCIAYSPCKTDVTHPDLFWYGIHGVETLFTVMGPGCISVQRTKTEGADIVTGIWSDGRVGTFRGIRDGSLGYGVVTFGEKGIQQTVVKPGYEQLVVEIVNFFRSRQPPVTPEQTLEIIAFMEAADISRGSGGKSVNLKDLSKPSAK